jgi:CheY-like chemotaxis protein
MGAHALRVLVVDDSGLSRKVFVRSLNAIMNGSHKLEVVECSNGQQAVDAVSRAMLKDRSFHVIFIDENMPVMRGSEAIKIIREMGFEGHIVCVTGAAAEECGDFIGAHAANEVIYKPCRLEQIEASLSAVLAGYMHI